MANQRLSSDTLDLFAEPPPAGAPPEGGFTVTPAARPLSPPRPTSGPTRPRPAELSDRDLHLLVSDVMAELERRVRRNTPSQHAALTQTVANARAVLTRLDGKPSRARDKPTTDLHETRRNAIRTALQAGVTPGQVARHFGLPLATVRKIAARAD